MRKRVLVTGGAKKLGAEISLTLAKSGYDVAIHYNKSEKEAFEVAEKCKSWGVDVQTIQGCFNSVDSLQKFICDYKKKCNQTYALINNVGNYLIKSALTTTYQEWESIFQNNLHVPFFLCQALASDLKLSKGVIVNLGVAGGTRMKANSYAAAYTIAKNGLFLLTKTLAQEFAPFHVKVNMISPGHLENSMDLIDPLKLPMKRAAQLSEIAKITLLLLSHESEYITGQNIEVAGGYLL